MSFTAIVEHALNC